LIAVRTLLGCFEAVIIPALIMITSMWYTRKEAGPRYGLWYSGLGAGQVIGGLISFGAQHGPHGGFESWRIMFVAVGAVNILVAITVLLFLPDSLESATFVSTHEKKLIATKLEADQTGNGAKVFKADSILEALKDTQIWLLCFLTILVVLPSGVITSYSAILVRGFGYTSKQAALLNMPSGIVSIFATIVSTAAIIKGFPRWISIILILIPTILGAGLMSFIPKNNQAGNLAGIYLVNAIVATLALINTWVGGNVAGYTKKVCATALVSVSFGIANIIGPQTFQAKDAPQYLPAKITIFAAEGTAIVVVILLRLLYGARNRKAKEYMARSAQSGGHSETLPLGEESNDLTDLQNPEFIYVL
jgi:MFS family permease